MTTVNSSNRQTAPTGGQLYLALNPGRRIMLLVCLFLVGFFMVGLLSAIVGMNTPAKVRIVTVLQDLLMFIMPALVMAVMVTRQPATLLCLDTKPRAGMLLAALVAMVVAMPAMEWVINLNNSMQLPEGLERTMRDMEENASATIALVTGPHTIPNLIMSILIVGVLAGLSEELLFRGALQRLFSTGGMNIHVAIWLSAVLFSLMHLQFYGFVPRTLLGAFFGYTLYWSGTVWVPVVLHIFNNTLYLVLEYCGVQPSSQSVLVISISLILAVIALIICRRLGEAPAKKTVPDKV